MGAADPFMGGLRAPPAQAQRDADAAAAGHQDAYWRSACWVDQLPREVLSLVLRALA